MLLQRGDDCGVTVEAVRDALNAERLPFEEDEVHALVEYMANEGEARGAATFADFKAFMRKGERMRATHLAHPRRHLPAPSARHSPARSLSTRRLGPASRDVSAPWCWPKFCAQLPNS